MKPITGPLGKLLYSRKFLLLVLDTIISAALYFVGKYSGEMVFADVKFIIAALQPVMIMLIAAIAWEDAAEKTQR